MSNSPLESVSKPAEEARALTFFQVVGSILASFFGVQSDRRRERDFKHGKARTFILVGVLMTIVWYSVIFLVVRVVLRGH